MKYGLSLIGSFSCKTAQYVEILRISQWYHLIGIITASVIFEELKRLIKVNTNQKQVVEMKSRRKITVQMITVLMIILVLISCTGIISGDNTNPNKTSNLDFIYNSIDTLFAKYVTADRGLVDYDGIWADPKLQQLVDTIEVFDLSSVKTVTDSLAFWINAYNVLVIYHLQDFGFTPQDQLGFPLFKTSYECAREKYSLDQIEKTGPAPIAKFKDPRTHFVLVCAALSCPPLLNKAYRGDSVYSQIDRKTREFLNSEVFNPILANSPPRVSSLFSFYPNDFVGYTRDASKPSFMTAGGSGGVKEFIVSYLTDQNKVDKIQNDPSNPINVISYDWTINKQ